jgi:DNA-binding phage protein
VLAENSDVELVLKHVDAFKSVVQTKVHEQGLSAVARKTGMNPANLAALLKKDHKPRFETIRKIAIPLGISEFPIKKTTKKQGR